MLAPLRCGFSLFVGMVFGDTLKAQQEDRTFFSYHTIHMTHAPNTTKLHIGKIVEKKLREQGRSPSWLARQLHCDRTNIYKIFKRESIDTNLLQRISAALDYDFFHLFSPNDKGDV